MCMGCYLQDAASEMLRGPGGQTMPGTTVRLIPNTPERRAEQAEHARRMREGDQE